MGTQKKSGSRGAGRTARTTEKLSDPQEVDFLDRREGTVWTPREVDRGFHDLRQALGDESRDSGGHAWRVGDKATELYNGFAERARGELSFVALACRETDLEPDALHEYLRVRRRVDNEEEARTIGRAKLRLGFRLLKALGLQTFEALRERDLPQSDGSTVRFPARVRQLSEALRLLKQRSRPQPSRKLAAEAVRRNGILHEARAEFPELANLRAKFVARDDDVWFESPPMSSAQQRAMAQVLARIDAE